MQIIQKDDKRLRSKAKELTLKDIGSPAIKDLINNMKGALSHEEDGVAIAAPQLGAPWRIFVISGNIFRKKGGKRADDMVFINPQIIKKSKESALMDEGCLSVRWYYGLVKRAKKVKVRALNEKGYEFVKENSGLLAQIYQHEIDHLDGILFTDKAKSLVELPPPQASKSKV
jgi:peptide deformylase